MSEKRCETCEHFVMVSRSKDKGYCTYDPPVLPVSMDLTFRYVRSGEGHSCPCWEEKK